MGQLLYAVRAPPDQTTSDHWSPHIQLRNDIAWRLCVVGLTGFVEVPVTRRTFDSTTAQSPAVVRFLVLYRHEVLRGSEASLEPCRNELLLVVVVHPERRRRC